MADQDLCTWCNNYGASTWSRKINNKNQVTKQKFCCLKCKTQYDDRYGIDWVEEKKANGFLIFIIIVIILYVLSQK
jgi:hypothetical protein